MAVGLLVWMWFGTGYRIGNVTIKIENGPFRSKVTINEIKKISKRRSLLATPALSVGRLVLQCGKYNEILLSPKNENKFIELLLTKNPQIKIDEKISIT
ncbi:PH domain-containing protein [Sporosarcina sp. FA9]|uniref:PH domain-containing protein n=1 Tax=Sporosarcina sp. FA9 TaxID=3413030 RepID=UPI003F65A478